MPRLTRQAQERDQGRADDTYSRAREPASMLRLQRGNPLAVRPFAVGLQVAYAVAALQEPRQPLKNRSWVVRHRLLPLKPAARRSRFRCGAHCGSSRGPAVNWGTGDGKV